MVVKFSGHKLNFGPVISQYLGMSTRHELPPISDWIFQHLGSHKNHVQAWKLGMEGGGYNLDSSAEFPSYLTLYLFGENQGGCYAVHQQIADFEFQDVLLPVKCTCTWLGARHVQVPHINQLSSRRQLCSQGREEEKL